MMASEYLGPMPLMASSWGWVAVLMSRRLAWAKSKAPVKSDRNANRLSIRRIVRQVKIGILADEFFVPDLQGMGGFGWAAWQLIEHLRQEFGNRVEPVFVSGELRDEPDGGELRIHGCRVLRRGTSTARDVVKLQREGFALLISIDYNRGYSRYLRALPRTPVIFWVRDPRTAADREKVESCRIPGREGVTPEGLFCVDGNSMQQLWWEARLLGRPMLFATPAPYLVGKLPGCYGFEPPRVHFLPNPIGLRANRLKSGEPTVVFLGRLDPIKRPWVFVELARRLPQVQFLMLGQAHFRGEGAYKVEAPPSNLHVLGHQGEEAKTRLLSEAWATVNTSVHEGLAVSFLESFACETPVISCQDPGYLVSRFGRYTGRFDGTGLEGLDAFEVAMRYMLEQPEKWLGKGREARLWLQEEYRPQEFGERLRALCGMAGRRLPEAGKDR